MGKRPQITKRFFSVISTPDCGPLPTMYEWVKQDDSINIMAPKKKFFFIMMTDLTPNYEKILESYPLLSEVLNKIHVVPMAHICRAWC